MEINHFWSWFAGFIDGEGCIGIYKINKKNGKLYLQPKIQIANTNKFSLEFIKNNAKINSNITQRQIKKKKDKLKIGYSLVISNKDECYRILCQISPFLITKKTQAELVLAFLKKHFKKSIPIDNYDNELFLQLKALNKKGL